MDINPSVINHQLWNPCNYASIETFEGDGIDGPRLGKWCDNSAPPAIMSTGSSLTVRLFMRDEFLGHFAATYSVLNTGIFYILNQTAYNVKHESIRCRFVDLVSIF